MIHWTREAARKILDRLLHVHDTPHRTALAFALGVFLGFSPFLGLHTILGVALAFLLGLNRVAVIVGIYSDLPWIMPQWYALTTATGAWLMGTDIPPGYTVRLRNLFELSLFSGEFWTRLASLVEPLLWPFAVGSAIGAAILAGVAYWIALGFIEAQRRHLFHLPHHGDGAPHGTG
jgi:uncharacterized protein (DUF2062 family)